MNFENGHLYHVFNQGNNRQKIFFKRENYAFFIQKIRTHLLPHADVLAWCLMPNHFHLLLVPCNGSTRSATLSRAPSATAVTLNQSIGIILASYTRAINIQENSTGSLFRQKTKAQCLTKLEEITPAYINSNFGSLITLQTPENQYPQVCFNYIHQNPVKAKLVKKAEDWEFSSYRDYCGLRTDEGLVNLDLAKTFFDFSSDDFSKYSSDDSKSSDDCSKYSSSDSKSSDEFYQNK
jgi:putative transposase